MGSYIHIAKQTALEGQDFFCTYLAHHELDSIKITMIVIVIAKDIRVVSVQHACQHKSLQPQRQSVSILLELPIGQACMNQSHTHNHCPCIYMYVCLQALLCSMQVSNLHCSLNNTVHVCRHLNVVCMGCHFVHITVESRYMMLTRNIIYVSYKHVPEAASGQHASQQSPLLPQ